MTTTIGRILFALYVISTLYIWGMVVAFAFGLLTYTPVFAIAWVVADSVIFNLRVFADGFLQHWQLD